MNEQLLNDCCGSVAAGGFNVDMIRQRRDDRTIKCQYDPLEPGDYVISIKWSGENVPGSPFQVRIFDSDTAGDQRPHRTIAASSSSMPRHGGGGPNVNGVHVFHDDYD